MTGVFFIMLSKGTAASPRKAKKRLAIFMPSRKWTRGNFLLPKTMTFSHKTSVAKVGSTGAFSAAGSNYAAFNPYIGCKKGSKSFADLGAFCALNAPKVTGVKHSGNKGFKLCTLGAFENLYPSYPASGDIFVKEVIT